MKAKPMTLNELAAALREHNAWRRGEGKYDGEPSVEPMPHTPKQLGKILDQAAEALEAYAQQAEVCGEWQPIETAPKDGTYILVIDSLGDLPFAKVSCWDKEKQEFWYPHCTKPMFWMRLRKPPIARGKKLEGEGK